MSSFFLHLTLMTLCAVGRFFCCNLLYLTTYFDQAESKFWFGVWQAAGRPREGELFILQQNAYMQYKYSIRRLKRAKSQILQVKFTQKIFNGGGDIFKGIYKFRGQCKTIQIV